MITICLNTTLVIAQTVTFRTFLCWGEHFCFQCWAPCKCATRRPWNNWVMLSNIFWWKKIIDGRWSGYNVGRVLGVTMMVWGLKRDFVWKVVETKKWFLGGQMKVSTVETGGNRYEIMCLTILDGFWTILAVILLLKWGKHTSTYYLLLASLAKPCNALLGSALNNFWKTFLDNWWEIVWL